jgi:hypothetical protein
MGRLMFRSFIPKKLDLRRSKEMSRPETTVLKPVAKPEQKATPKSVPNLEAGPISHQGV